MPTSASPRYTVLTLAQTRLLVWLTAVPGRALTFGGSLREGGNDWLSGLPGTRGAPLPPHSAAVIAALVTRRVLDPAPTSNPNVWEKVGMHTITPVGLAALDTARARFAPELAAESAASATAARIAAAAVAYRGAAGRAADADAAFLRDCLQVELTARSPLSAVPTWHAFRAAHVELTARQLELDAARGR